MGKKKQPDFQKTKLRVGRTLPKGRNVTDTSFKTRKIVTHDQLRATGDVSLKDLLNYLGHNNVSTKKETLHKLKNYIQEKKETLTLFFPDILKKVGGILLEDDAGVRDVAMEVMHTCFKLLSGEQIKCFIGILTSYLNCMMTHFNNAIRKDSLRFLDKILSTHPDAVCHFIKVLSTVLNLISSVVHEKTSSRSRKRKLDELISSNMTSQEWRIEVLKRIYIFLQCSLTVENENEEEAEEKREVHWNGTKPLFLPLYIRGGVSPVPYELLNGDSEEKSIDSKEFQDFMYDLVPLLSEVIKGEISSKQSSDHNVVEPSVLKHLNIVVQILCCLGEWLQNKSRLSFVGDTEFNKLLVNIVCRQLMKHFPYTQHESSYIKKKSDKRSLSESMQLNLGICYLYCLLVLDTESVSFEKEQILITYLDKAFSMSNSMCNKSIDLMLKISRIVVKSNVNITYKNGILLGLYGILEVHKLSMCAKSIYSFFMDVSLGFDFKYLLDSEGMKTWFDVILKELVFMMESGAVNKQFLKYIRQICARKYSYFLELLNKVKKENLLELLKYDDEEFQLTIIHLICSLNQPSVLLREDLIEILSDPSFNLKTATRMVYLLHSRLSSQDVPSKEKYFFLKFLLNLGCDTLMLDDLSWESKEKCSDMLRSILCNCHYELYPSSKSERHLELTKVCFECLPPYLEIKAFAESFVHFIKTILVEDTKLPIHCVIALLKLRRDAYMYQYEHLVNNYNKLIFSCGLYLSVMLIGYKEKGLESYAIPELQESLQLERDDATDIISVINSSIDDIGVAELYHALRFTKYLIHTNIFQLEDRSSIFEVLEKINSVCQDSELLHPLWTNICKFFRLI